MKSNELCTYENHLIEGKRNFYHHENSPLYGICKDYYRQLLKLINYGLTEYNGCFRSSPYYSTRLVWQLKQTQ